MTVCRSLAPFGNGKGGGGGETGFGCAEKQGGGWLGRVVKLQYVCYVDLPGWVRQSSRLCPVLVATRRGGGEAGKVGRWFKRESLDNAKNK